jgi:glutamate racemase
MRSVFFKPSFRLVLLLFLFPFRILLAKAEKPMPELKLDAFFQKQKVTIAVTDSGLGGLSVMAEAVRRMKEARNFKVADFIFFNALFSSEGGYNSLRTREEKIAVFDSALESLEKKFRPDVILIGCNTLSVLYEDTSFAGRTKTPVIGIVDPGVDLIARSLAARPDSAVIIFGTPTTIAEKSYQQRLLDLGFAEKRVIGQSCPELESFIEKEYGGDETAMLISGCVDEAIQRIPPPWPPLFISLNCTHYGYSLPLWEKAFEEAGIKPLAILNPNSRMTDVLIRPEFSNRHPKTDVSARVVSMVEIGRGKVESLGKWLLEISPETAAALRNYRLDPALFEWKSLVKR